MKANRMMTLLAGMTICMTVGAQGKFSIKGQVANADGETVYLTYGGRTNPTKDSTVVQKGKFALKGTTDKPCKAATLTLGKERRPMGENMLQIYLEPGTITVKGTAGEFMNATVKGGKTQAELNELNAAIRDDMKHMMELNQQYYQPGANRDSLAALMRPYSEHNQQAQAEFLKAHPSSYIAPSLIEHKMGNMGYGELKAAYDAFRTEVQQSDEAARIKAELTALEKQQPGQTAPDFTANDINGKPFTLSSLKGKVVILDFWASWCGPCRKSNPHMRELYKKYHPKGLELVYVASDDRAEAKWRKAVEEDKLKGEGYHHVLEGYDSNIARGMNPNCIGDMYAVHYLPTKFLIDRDGKIVGKVESDKWLDEQLQRLLGKPEYPFTIEGTVSGADGKQVVLHYGTREDMHSDTTTVSNGQFTFKGALDGLFSTGNLILGDYDPYSRDNSNIHQLFMEPGTLTVSAPDGILKTATVTGNKTQEEANALSAQTETVYAQLETLRTKLAKTKNAKQKQALESQIETLQKQSSDLLQNFYKTHPDSYLSAYYLRFFTGRMSYDELKQTYEGLSERVRLYGDTDEIASEIETLGKVQPGSPAPDFTSKDINGQELSLSSLKGKVVILDFWASWCRPCRASNPHMLELYKKYHDRGLDMVYVSDDDSNEAKWRDAVEKDGLTGDGFHHVLRGLKRVEGPKMFDKTNDISDKYAVHYLPTKFLIDREGRIVCKIDEGQDELLDQKLAELLK